MSVDAFCIQGFSTKICNSECERKDKQQWTSYTHSQSPCILYTPRSRRRYPLGATNPWTQEVVPFPPGAETGRQRRHRPDPGDPGLAPAPPRRTQSPTTPIHLRRGGYVQKRGPYGSKQPANRSRPRTEQSRPPNELRSQPHESPTPSEPQHEPPHRATLNKDTDIEHIPLNPNATNPLPHRGTPPQVNSMAEKPMKPHPHNASSTHSPALRTPAAPPPHIAPQGKGPAQLHPRPLAQQGRPHRAPHHDGTNSSTKRSQASSRHTGPVTPTTPPSATKNTTSLQRPPREKHYPAQLHRHRPADPNAGDPTP
ncbi:hypothetical protein GOODEAATRI_031703 [Goodea atripinnis]|uniref:Uncharacterized protein n=1 Tax=Goodea atripinnis TaxID=208336 RepID=A0ABV0PTA4_9TELE